MWEEYRPLALQHLVLPSPHHDESSERVFDEGPERLLIQFLFPGIAEKGMLLMVEVRELRWRLRCAKRYEKESQSILSAHSEEQIEAMFAEKCRVLEGVLNGLSVVQQELIREKFFRIEDS